MIRVFTEKINKINLFIDIQSLIWDNTFMKSYRDKPDYKLYKILDDLLTHTSNEDGIPVELKEQAQVALDEWAVRQMREMADDMEDLPE